MTIAVSAFACSENRGSEHELGWKCLKELATPGEDVHLFTSGYVNPGIIDQVTRHELSDVTVHLVDFPRVVDRILKSCPWTGYQFVAYLWEFRLFVYMFGRFERKHFDRAVKSTYGSYRWPSFLWYFSKNLQLDPISGGGGFPLRFKTFFSPSARYKELFRMFMQRLSFLDPFVLLTLWKAEKIHVGNSSTQAIMPSFARNKCVVKEDFLKVEAKDFRMEEAKQTVSTDPERLKIFYTGKLHEWKGVMVVLQALARLPGDVKYLFTVMGNGPARKLYNEYIAKQGLNVIFVDPKSVPRSDLSFYFFSHDLFAFPTLHGESGFAPIEAKLHGMKLLTLDFSGLNGALTSGDICIQTEGKDADAVVQAMADSIEALYDELKCQLLKI